MIVLALLVGHSCGEDGRLPEDAIDASVPPPGGFRGEQDPDQCGNGRLDAGEACDDGSDGACGDCNSDCTGPGTGSVCGDGVVCRETEVCDDGGTDDCGTCNADCSGEGTGSICGDGEVCPDSEACDDGATDDCGDCNADCSGSGTGPAVCGDGDTCQTADFGVEACDDGYTDACGSCNEDCTDVGAGAECGDGELCPELEVCDDALGDACGDVCACPDTMFLPESGCAGVSSSGMFNPNEVYIYGDVWSGDPPRLNYALVHWSTPSAPLTGVDGLDGGHVIRPEDGAVVYFRAQANVGGIFEFRCDACPWNPIDDYPIDYLLNDVDLGEKCSAAARTYVRQMLMSPDGLILHECTDPDLEFFWYDETGTLRITGLPMSLGHDGVFLGEYASGPFGYFVAEIDGSTSEMVTGLPPAATGLAFRAIRIGGDPHFRMVIKGCACDSVQGVCDSACHCDADCPCACDATGGCDSDCGCDDSCGPTGYDLWVVNGVTGVATVVQTYGPRPGVAGLRGGVKLDAAGNLYGIANLDDGAAIIRYPVDGSDAEFIYVPASQGVVTLGLGARLFTGP